MKRRGVLTMWNRSLKTFTAATLVALFLAGCGQGSTKTTDSDKPPVGPDMSQPITMTLFTEIPMLPDDFDRLVVQPVKKKFPAVTLQRVETAKGGNQIQDLVTAGSIPDLMLTGFNFLGNLMQLELPLELDESVKNAKLDLSVFDDTVMSSLKGYKNGKLIGLPFYLNTTILAYNKDIFDKFGLPYPKDGMNWNETLDMAKKLTKMDAGVQYYGLLAGSWDTLGSQLSLQKIDPATNKAAVNSDGFKTALSLLKDVSSIPGMNPKLTGTNGFYKDRTLAMYNFWLTDVITAIVKSEAPMNWDLVNTPYFTQKPGVGAKVDSHLFVIPSQSKYKDQAFEIAKFLTTEVANQTTVAQTGRIPAIKNAEVQKHFAENYENLKGKNFQAVFKNKMAPLPKFHPLDSTAVSKPMNDAVTAVTQNGVDVNTALRDAEEGVNKNIAAAQGAK